MGDYLPAKLDFEDGEKPLLIKAVNDSFKPEHHIIYIFENGKGVRIPVSAYETKSNRKKLTGAYSDKSPIAGIEFTDEELQEDMENVQAQIEEDERFVFNGDGDF
jgi:DNA gyrase subunit A